MTRLTGMPLRPAILAMTLLAGACGEPPALAECTPEALGVSRTIMVTADTPPVETLLEPGEVILTFDDGPDVLRTGRVLEVLNGECTRATFFLLGNKTEAHPGIAAEIVEAGHTVGSHSWDHANLATMDVDAAIENALLAKEAVEKAAGQTTLLFRLPFIASTPELMTAVKDAGLIHVTATVDGQDWTQNPAQDAADLIMSKLEQNGRLGIVLLHDPVVSSDKRIRVLMDRLRAEGYSIVALEGPKP